MSLITNSYLHRGYPTSLFPLLLFTALISLMLFSLTFGRYPIAFTNVMHIVLTTSPINATGDYANTAAGQVTSAYPS